MKKKNDRMIIKEHQRLKIACPMKACHAFLSDASPILTTPFNCKINMKASVHCRCDHELEL
jgi:hypothetical protein